MSNYYVFNTEQEAVTAEAWISRTGELPITGKNASTGEPEPLAAKTERWAIPSQRTDGKWVFPCVPDAVVNRYSSDVIEYFNTNFPHDVEEWRSNWFPAPELYV